MWLILPAPGTLFEMTSFNIRELSDLQQGGFCGVLAPRIEVELHASRILTGSHTFQAHTHTHTRKASGELTHMHCTRPRMQANVCAPRTHAHTNTQPCTHTTHTQRPSAAYLECHYGIRSKCSVQSEHFLIWFIRLVEVMQPLLPAATQPCKGRAQ